MSEAVLAAAVTAGLSLIGTMITVLAASRQTLAAMDKKSELADETLRGQINVIQQEIATLSDRVDRHNHLVERTYSLEARVRVLEAAEGGRNP